MSVVPTVSPLPTVKISATSHRVSVIGEDRVDVGVEGKATVKTSDHATEEPRNRTVHVNAVASKITVRVPLGTHVVIGSSSGRIDIIGDLGQVSVATESGKVTIESAACVDVRSDSGKVTVANTDGICRIRTKHGSVRVHGCGDADIFTGSGRIDLGAVHGEVRAHCISGRINVSMDQPGDVDAETVSGRINVTLPRGTVVHHTTHSDEVAPNDVDCIVVARSVSGRIEIATR